MSDRQSASLLLLIGAVIALIVYNRGTINVVRSAVGLPALPV